MKKTQIRPVKSDREKIVGVQVTEKLQKKMP